MKILNDKQKLHMKLALKILIIIIVIAIIFFIGLLVTLYSPITENNTFLSNIKNHLFSFTGRPFFPTSDSNNKNTKLYSSNTREEYEGGNYDEQLKICTPKLGKDMVGVYWSDGSKNSDGTYKANYASTKIEVTSDDKNFSWKDWYDYVGINTTDDHKLSTWANAKRTSDGSYFVWIPRFEYKLTNEHTNKVGTVTVNFINTSQTSPSSSEFKVHPAFTKGTDNYNLRSMGC
ncbi:MAG: hypothetical protein HFJ17_04290 [Clostridia bacterium]|nr:hypothetical protein [Clostridia bacterium]